MNKNTKKILILSMTLVTSSMAAAKTPDSTDVVVPTVVPVVQSYMLANGQIATTTGAYDVKFIPTAQRCPANTTPNFITSITSVDVYGAAQAIEGVHNTLALNQSTYEISGRISAPVNVEARDNGAKVNWQIWCKPIETA